MQTPSAQPKAESRRESSVARGFRSDMSNPHGSGGAPSGLPIFLRLKHAAGNRSCSNPADATCDEEPQPLDLEPGSDPGPIQKKVMVGPPDDPLEREADAVAQVATASKLSAAPGTAEAELQDSQRCLCGGTCSRCVAQETLQRRATVFAVPSQEPHAALPGGEGAPLNSQVRQRVEPLLAADLGSVIVHQGPESARSAVAIGARAYTSRNHIWLGPHERPEDTELLAHEATHVVQQSGQASSSSTLQRKARLASAIMDSETVRERNLARFRMELGDNTDTLKESQRPPRVAGAGNSLSLSGLSGAAANVDVMAPDREPLTQIDRGELPATKGLLEPLVKPDVDPAAEVAPQVVDAAKATTALAETPGESVVPQQQPVAGAEAGEAKSPELTVAEQAADQADAAFASVTSQTMPADPPAIQPPRPVPPVDAKGLPVLTDASHDASLADIADQAQTLRQEALNLRQHAAEERANAYVLRGNLNLALTGVSQAEQGVATSSDHLSYRREVAETAQQSLEASKQKAQTVAEQTPGFAEQADEGKAATKPMASEAADMAGEGAAKTPEDPEAAGKAREQSGKLSQASSEIASTDQAIEQTQTRAGSLQAEATQAAQLNSGTENRLATVEARLSSTEAKLTSMQEQNASARKQINALNSQPEAMLAQAQALDQQGQLMLTASADLEQRLQGAQDTHQSALQSLPEILPAEPDLAVQAELAPGMEPGGGLEALPAAIANPEDLRYEDRQSVDLASHVPSWFSGANPVSAEARAQAEQRERDRRSQEVAEIRAMAGDNIATIHPGRRAWIALRMTGRHVFGSLSGIQWPGWGHLALGLIDPRGPLMGVVSGLGMMLTGGANLLSGEQWSRDPLGNLLKSAADVATGLTIILGSITALAAVIIAIMGAATLLTLGTAAPVTGPIIAFCTTVMTTVGGWTLAVGKVALILQGLVLIKNLIDAACATTAEQLQNQSDKLTADVASAGNVVMQMGMAKLSQVGGRAMQSEISAASGGVNFARRVGGVATTDAASYARAVGGVVRSAPGRLSRGVASLATREGRGQAWAGVKGMFRNEGEPISTREGLSRDFLVGRREPLPAAGPAEVSAPRAGESAPAPAPRPAEPIAPAPGEPPPPPRPAEATASRSVEPTPRPAEAAPPPREPVPEAPGPAEPETGLARERSLETSGHLESGELTPQQMANETRFIEDNPHLVREGPPRNIKIGEHEWIENPGGGWCRHSNGQRCVPRLRVERGPELTPDNVDDIINELKAKRSVTPEEEARLRSVAEQPEGIWKLRAELGEAGSPALRGEVGHQLLGEELPYARVIDSAPRIDPTTGLALEVRSIKTHQLYGYQEPGAFAARLKAEARELSRFRATRSSGTLVQASKNTDRVLVIGVPPRTLQAIAGRPWTAQWRAEALEAMNYALKLKPPVRIRFITIR